MGSVAALASPLGVRLSIIFQGKYVARAMGVFMLTMGSFMAYTLWESIQEDRNRQASDDAALERGEQPPAPTPSRGLTDTWERMAGTTLLGAGVGLVGGAFGVGGGVILVPILTRLTDVQTATATSLASIIPPTLVSTAVCARAGMIMWPLTPWLIFGAGVGKFACVLFSFMFLENLTIMSSTLAASYFSAKYAAVLLSRPQQKGAFVGTMAILGTRMMLVKS